MRLYDFRWEPSILYQSPSDLKVAVIGTGHIGSIIAQILSEGYRCDVVAYDPFPNEVIKLYVTYKSILQEAISDADIVTIHIPATKYNPHLFDDNVFKSFKSGVIFVNCARGRLVDTKALLSAIDRVQIKGAALDTYEHEVGILATDQRGKNINDPYLDALIERDDVIFTPHIAFYTEVAVRNLIYDGL